MTTTVLRTAAGHTHEGSRWADTVAGLRCGLARMIDCLNLSFKSGGRARAQAASYVGLPNLSTAEPATASLAHPVSTIWSSRTWHPWGATRVTERPPAPGANPRLPWLAPRLEVLYEEQDFRRYQSGQPIVFSGAYIITVLQYVYIIVVHVAHIAVLRDVLDRLAPSETQFRPRNLEPRLDQTDPCHRVAARLAPP